MDERRAEGDGQEGARVLRLEYNTHTVIHIRYQIVSFHFPSGTEKKEVLCTQCCVHTEVLCRNVQCSDTETIFLGSGYEEAFLKCNSSLHVQGIENFVKPL